MNRKKSSLWIKLVEWTLGRCLFLYMLLIGASLVLIDRHTVLNNRMNFLLQNEASVKAFSVGRVPIDYSAFKMAVRYYTELRRFAPRDGLLCGNQGFCYYHLGQKQQALEMYQKALMLEPTCGPLQLDLATMFFEIGWQEKAAVIWSNYLENKESIKRYCEALRGQLRLIKREDVLFLIDDMEKSFVVDERETYIKLSEAYFLLQKYSLAAETALAGLKRFPQNRWLNFVAGFSRYKESRWTEAAGYFSEAIKSEPHDINSYYYRSLCMQSLGEPQKFLQDLSHVKQLHARGVSPFPFPKGDAALHFDTEVLFIRYHLQDAGKLERNRSQ